MKLSICTPETYAVYQRDKKNNAKLPIHGYIKGCFGKVNGIVSCKPVILENFISPSNQKPTLGDWIQLTYNPAKKEFSGEIILPAGGWYGLELKFEPEKKSAINTLIKPFGVGEVILTGGQSNSANSGQEKLSPKTDKVTAWGPKVKRIKAQWRPATDPQPFTNGTGGTPWPPMADILVDKLHVPIGLISMGVGGTRVDQWLPGHEHYPRIKTATKKIGPNGARVYLWHQGESDSLAKTPAAVYKERMQTVIKQSQDDAGFPLPWLIATVSFIASAPEEDRKIVVEGQKMAVDNKTIFDGPTTDDILGPQYRHDNLHFNGNGLREHGRRWAQSILDLFAKEFQI